jgi:hypothetical protein
MGGHIPDNLKGWCGGLPNRLVTKREVMGWLWAHGLGEGLVQVLWMGQGPMGGVRPPRRCILVDTCWSSLLLSRSRYSFDASMLP